MKKILTHSVLTLIVAFALLTLFSSSAVIFDWFGARAKEGNYVLFIVWTNFISSILYLFSAYGLIKLKSWAYLLLAASSLILIIAFIALLIHINNGGLFEEKTIGIMPFRIGLTIIFTAFTYIRIERWSI